MFFFALPLILSLSISGSSPAQADGVMCTSFTEMVLWMCHAETIAAALF